MKVVLIKNLIAEKTDDTGNFFETWKKIQKKKVFTGFLSPNYFEI